MKLVLKILVIIAAWSVVLAVLIRGAKREALSSVEQAWLDKHGRMVKVAPAPAWPPLDTFTEDGQYEGIAADYLELIGERLGISFEFVRYESTRDVLEAIKARKIDVLTSTPYTLERSEFLQFTESYANVPTMIVVQRSVTGDLTEADLAGMRIAVGDQFAAHEYMRQRYPMHELIPVPTDLVGLQKVSFGEVDAALVDMASASYFIEREGISNLRIAGRIGYVYDASFAVRNDQPILRRIMDKGLWLITEDEREDIFRKWVHLEYEPFYKERSFWIVIGTSAAVIFTAVVLVGGWNLSLRRMVAQRTVELDKELAERKQAEKEREALLKTLSAKNEELEGIVYVSSHDLRSPLVNIQGHTFELARTCKEIEQLLSDKRIPADMLEKFSSLFSEEILVSVGFITSSTSKMDMLLNGLLKLCRLGAVPLELEQINVNSMFDEIISAMRYQIKRSGVNLKVDDLPSCYADSLQLNQVFTNILDNSIKYLSPEREGEIHVSGESSEGESIYCVEDNGIGISMDYQKKVFDLFHRLDPESPVKGEGLGLTIVRRIVDRFDGRVWYESEPGIGTRFYISLPDKKEG